MVLGKRLNVFASKEEKAPTWGLARSQSFPELCLDYAVRIGDPG